MRVVGVEGEGVELSPVQRSTEAAREERTIESKNLAPQNNLTSLNSCPYSWYKIQHTLKHFSYLLSPLL